MHNHKLSLGAAILLNINIMIGSGILIGPGQIAAIACNASFLAWPIVALLFLPIVLCTVQLSRMFPGAGGFYSYAKEGLNSTAGFASGWLYVVGYTLCICVDVLALRQTLAVFAGHNIIIDSPVLFNGICIMAYVLFNLLSFKIVSSFLNSLTIAKIVPLMALVLLLPFIIQPTFSITMHEIGFLPYSLPLAIFGFVGFEACISVSHLIVDSKKNAPRAILIGFLITAALYTLFHFGVLNVMGSQKLITLGAPAFAEFLHVPIPYLKNLLMLLIPLTSIVTMIAAATGLMNANAIMLHEMAQEKLFKGWSYVTKMSNHGRPWVAIVLEGVAIFCIATVIPNIAHVGGLCNLGIFLSFILPFVSLLLLQYKKRELRKIPLTMIALSMIVGLSGYSWYALGDSILHRCLCSLPLFVAMGIGYLILRRVDHESSGSTTR